MSKYPFKKLSEICDFLNGLWTGKEPPFIKVGVIRNTNFSKGGYLDYSDIAYLDVEEKQYGKRKLQFGDLILEKSGGGPKQPVGRVVIFDKKEGEFSFSNFTSVLRVKNSEEVYFQYLHRFLHLLYISGVTEKMQSHSTGIRNLVFSDYKEIEIPLPPLSVQEEIVAKLDSALASIDEAKTKTEQALAATRELWESTLEEVFATSTQDWEEKILEEVCAEIFAGGDVPKNNFSKEKTLEYPIPIYANAVKNNGLYGYTNFARVTQPSITIAARGSGTGHAELRFNAYFPIVRLIVLIPNAALVSLEFLKYKIGTLDILRSGSAIPQLTVPMIKDYKILLPSLVEQHSIVTRLNTLRAETDRLSGLYEQKLRDLDELRRSVLQEAFA